MRWWDACRSWGWFCVDCARERRDDVFVGMRYAYFVGGTWMPRWGYRRPRIRREVML